MNNLKEKIQQAENVIVLSGAGLSAPSGVATFRATDGLWNKHRILDVAVLDGFINDPSLAWEFYDIRRQELPNVYPNAGHIALAQLQQSRSNVYLITQNVDNLLERAGCTNVIHIHGKLWETKCNDCGDTISEDIEPRMNNHTCIKCNGLLRPNVTLYGERLPTIECGVLSLLMWKLTAKDILIIVGTSLEVGSVSGYPSMAFNKGATIIEINPEPVLLPENAFIVPFGCEEVLPLLI